MLPGIHTTDGSTALKLHDGPGSGLVLAGAESALSQGGGARLLEHTLGGEVDVADLEAVLRPIREAAGAYAILAGPARDLAWEKAQWTIAVDAQIARGRTEAEAVQAVMLQPPTRWGRLLDGGKDGGDQRCVPNFRRWKKKMGMDRAGRVKRQNWAGLAKRRGGGQISNLDEHFMRAFYQLYLHPNSPDIEPTRRKIARIWRLRGLESVVPTEAQVRNAVAKSVTKTLELKYRSERNRFADLVKGWIRRDVNAEAGEIWFMDHRICDFWVRTTNADGEQVAVRPWITAVFDARSFCCIKAIIYVDSNPNHERIMEAFQEAVRMAGNRPPRVLYIDNGKDFLKMGLGTTVQLATKLRKGTLLCNDQGQAYEYSVMAALGVRVLTARGYNGKEKPIERWFRDMARDWDKTRRGYTGHNHATRPDFGDTWQGDVMRLETVVTARESFDTWIEEEANLQPREDGVTRGDIWTRRPLDTRPQLDDLDLFVRLLLPQRVAPLVRRSSMGGGVAFGGWQYSHADLHEHWDEPVMVKTCWHAPRVTVPVQTRSQGKVHREVPACVFVFTLDDRMICGAIADPVFDMFADDEGRARIGAAQHLINAVVARDGELFAKLTGRKQLADPSRVLAELEGGRDQYVPTVALTEDPSAPTRTLRGSGKTIAERVQSACTEPAEADEAVLAFHDSMMAAGDEPDGDGEDEDQGFSPY